MRKLGIVGGASCFSTALYYEQINKGVADALGGLHSARLSIESLDFEDDYAAYHRRGDWAGAEQVILAAAARLKGSGAEGILLCSNTMHRHAEAVAGATGLEVIDIRTAAATRIADDHRRRVALLGTRFTMTEDWSRSPYEAAGLTLVDLSPDWRTEVDRIIYQELAAGRVVRDSQRKLRTLITELGKKRVEAVVLGCTELVLAIDPRANVLPVYDTTAIHAKAAVSWILEEREAKRAAA